MCKEKPVVFSPVPTEFLKEAMPIEVRKTIIDYEKAQEEKILLKPMISDERGDDGLYEVNLAARPVFKTSGKGKNLRFKVGGSGRKIHCHIKKIRRNNRGS